MSTLWLKKQKTHNIFLREKPIELLLCLMKRTIKAKYPSMLAKEAKCTYSHTVHLLQKMEKNGLVTFKKKGRLKLVDLTEKGKQVSNLFERIGKTLVN